MSVCFWESGNISRPNDDAVIGQCDLIVERGASKAEPNALTNYQLPIPIGYPKVNQNNVCLLSNRGLHNKPRLRLFVMGRSEGTSCFNDDAVIGLRNLVTERDKTRTCLFALGRRIALLSYKIGSYFWCFFVRLFLL